MAKIESYAPGSFCWAELATTDTDAAKQFYGGMFGWTALDHPMPNGVYTMFQAEGLDAAAVYQAPPGVPPHWGVYFSVTDVEASAAQIGALGGKLVMGPMDIGAGIMVVAQDPQGAHFSLWQAKQHIGATYGGALGRAVWPELHTPDVAGAVAFYGSLLSWKTRPAEGVATAPYVELVNDGESIGGIMPQQGMPPYWNFYVTVGDCDERVAHAAAAGGKICVPPADIPNTGRFSVIGDPQGAMFSIIQMTGTHQPAA